ncbi:MAG: thioredoxin domain-containing protein [Proteobacteria bacterium]|nr:thioredoxin domain-containing protein [Pseudomonadota bacterium]
MIKPFQILFAAVLLLTPPSGAVLAGEEESLSKQQIEEIIRNYILENPEIITQAVLILREREEQRTREAVQLALADNHDLLFNDELSIVVGNPEGDVTLVEFYDYRCSFCRQSHGAVMQMLEEDKNLRLVLKQFPVKDQPGEVPVSLISARLAMAAEKQGLFLPFHDAMFLAEPPLTERKVYAIAKEVGLDLERLEKDMREPAFTEHLRQTLTLASEIGATGTPTFVIGGYVISSMLDAKILRQIIGLTREVQAAQATENASD